MRQLIALVCTFVGSSALCAERAPKAINSGLHHRAPVIDSQAISSVTADGIAPYEVAEDGTKFTVLHIRKSGAQAVRVRFANIRMPAGSALLVYGDVASTHWVYRGGPEDGAVVAGENVFVEIQCGEECPPDLPFEIAELETVEDVAVTSTPVVADRSVTRQVGNFGGVDIEYEVRDGLAIMEGDIILGPAHEAQPPTGNKHREKNAIGTSTLSLRWTGGRIPYSIDYDMPDQGRITTAVNLWNNSLGGAVRFVPRASESVYLRFVRGSGCSANVGMAWINTVTVGDGCATGNVIHELGHSIGLYHEQAREDRNYYVRVLTDNIATGYLRDFTQKISSADDIGPYNFDSIMHYSAYAGTVNGFPTMETIPAGIPIGQRNGLSAGDIAGVRQMYGYGYTVPTGVQPTSGQPQAPAPVPVPTPAPAPAPVSEPTPAPTVVLITVTVSANPATEKILVDGVPYVGSITQHWTAGSSHTISAVDRALSDGSTATFVRWSDGGAQSHSVTATSPALYRVDYSVGFSVSTSSSVGGTIVVSPLSASGIYASNSTIQLAAVPAGGYCFTGWSGLIAGSSPSTALTITKPYVISAQFGPATFSLSQMYNYISASAGTFSVGVSGASGCSWTAQAMNSWLRPSSTVGEGSKIVSYTVDANVSKGIRVGTIVIAGKTLYVIQYP